jgi:hypothetical protein
MEVTKEVKERRKEQQAVMLTGWWNLVLHAV